jgi:CDP-diacylglycerol--glycerol-3-phosphate 3-phosphatidyltransferase
VRSHAGGRCTCLGLLRRGSTTLRTEGDPLLTIPNLITAFRLVLLPLILWLTYATEPGPIAWAAGLFALAASSDWLDGYLARRLNMASRLGALMDPLVDKLMVLSILFAFVDLGLLPLWIVLVNMYREFVVTGLRHALSTRQATVGANWMGKTKYALQVALIELIYVQIFLESRGGGLPGGRGVLLWSALAVTVISFAFLANFARWHWRELLARVRQGE